MSKKNNLLVAASGTGGHIFPALAVSKSVELDWNIYWLGIKERLDANFVPKKYNLITLNIKTPKKNILIVYQYLIILMSTFRVLRILKEKKFIYEGKIKAPEGENNENWVEREQLLFKSTEFGDDKDRALQKEDKSWTYFASDVAYHNTKLKRNFDVLVNILGADHAGYIKRITSVVEALSGKKNKLICKVSQLVKLIKDKKPFKMSKRKGDYITIEDLINEVGKDATRFIMLSRSSDDEIDFDFDKVKEKSKENPIYYVQYAYARISSVFRNTQHEIKSDIKITNSEYKFGDQEIKLFKKISEWPKCVEVSTEKLEPHRISVYLYELASEFHSYWNMGKDDISKRFIEEDNSIKEEKLVFLKSIANTIKSGMDILGVDTPEKM